MIKRLGILFAVSGLFASIWACGSSTDDGPSGAVTARDASAETAAETSTDASKIDECTPKGWECHDTPSCRPEYQPVSSISCGAPGKTCCIKGVLPPTDASAD